MRDFILGDYHLREHSERYGSSSTLGIGGPLALPPRFAEQLDFLLLTVVKARKVHPDGIHFQGLRYVYTTLAAFVGESVMLRYDPRDVAEVRIFHQGRFLCRAICPELAGETIPLREVVRAPESAPP